MTGLGGASESGLPATRLSPKWPRDTHSASLAPVPERLLFCWPARYVMTDGDALCNTLLLMSTCGHSASTSSFCLSHHLAGSVGPCLSTLQQWGTVGRGGGARSSARILWSLVAASREVLDLPKPLLTASVNFSVGVVRSAPQSLDIRAVAAGFYCCCNALRCAALHCKASYQPVFLAKSPPETLQMPRPSTNCTIQYWRLLSSEGLLVPRDAEALQLVICIGSFQPPLPCLHCYRPVLSTTCARDQRLARG